MATAVLPTPTHPPDQQQQAAASAAGGGGNFSPLTLFECTMTNAGMLVDSMPVRDLVSALRIIGTLHTHVVNVMDPGVASVCDMAERFTTHQAACPAAAEAAAENDGNGGGGSVLSPAAGNSTAVDNGAGIASSRKRIKFDDDRGGDASCDAPSASAFVKSESLAESDDDCCILEDASIGVGSAFFAGGVGGQHPSSGGVGAPSIVGAVSTAAAAAAGTVATREDAATMKQILRNTYKAMRGGGPHLYDFNRPWNDPANQLITERIVSQIVATTPDMSVSPEEWRNGCYLALFNPSMASESAIKHEARKRAMRKYARVSSKLSRRQKAFEQVLPTLNPDDLDKYRVVLSRDFTSSDEETEDEASGETALRVRELSWESDEVRRVKQRLDHTFMTRFATQKQRATLQRCIRDSGCFSNRPAPHEVPQWALRPSPPAEQLG